MNWPSFLEKAARFAEFVLVPASFAAGSLVLWSRRRQEHTNGLRLKVDGKD
jgi:hypothetical protein